MPRSGQTLQVIPFWTRLAGALPRAAHATVERWLTPGTSRVISSLHAISRAFASVRLFAPEANADADSSAHWNPLYAMMGRPQASSPAENVDCSRGVVDKGG